MSRETVNSYYIPVCVFNVLSLLTRLIASPRDTYHAATVKLQVIVVIPWALGGICSKTCKYAQIYNRRTLVSLTLSFQVEFIVLFLFTGVAASAAQQLWLVVTLDVLISSVHVQSHPVA